MHESRKRLLREVWELCSCVACLGSSPLLHMLPVFEATTVRNGAEQRPRGTRQRPLGADWH